MQFPFYVSVTQNGFTFAVPAKILARLAVKPSSGREFMNRYDRHGGAKIARYKSPQLAVSSLQPAADGLSYPGRKALRD